MLGTVDNDNNGVYLVWTTWRTTSSENNHQRTLSKAITILLETILTMISTMMDDVRIGIGEMESNSAKSLSQELVRMVILEITIWRKTVWAQEI